MLRAISIFSLVMYFLGALVSQSTLSFTKPFSNGEISQVPQVVVQDSLGFIWIGTTDGLYRYDGQDVIEFRHNPLDTNSLSNNFILSLCVDLNGNLWIGTTDGMNVYYSEEERIERKFTHLDAKLGANQIKKVLIDSKNGLWFGTYYGLYHQPARSDELLQFLPQEPKDENLSHENIWSIFEDNTQRIWVATHGGFTIIDVDDNYNFSPYFGNNNPQDLYTDRVFEIVQSRDSSIWMSSYDGIFNVTFFDSSYHFNHYSTFGQNGKKLSDKRVFGLSYFDNVLWASTYAGGLNEIVLDSNSNEVTKIIHHRNNPSDNKSILSDYAAGVFQDKSGVYWVSTSLGLNKISNYANKFSSIYSDQDNKTTLSSPIVRSILKDSYGNLWVGTKKGINLLRSDKIKNGIWEWEQFLYDKENRFSLSHNQVESIYEDQNNNLWISTFYGLNYFSIKDFLDDQKMFHINDRDGIPHTYCREIIQIESDKYLLSSYGGFSKMTFDPAGQKRATFRTYDMDDNDPTAIANNSTNAIRKDRFGTYWIGSINGLCNLLEEDYFANYMHDPSDNQSLSNNAIMCLFVDSKERLWVGTRSGLNVVVQDNKSVRATFKKYGIADGLPNDVIMNIVEDDDGMLWVSTNRGLVLFDPEAPQPVKRVFEKLDGMLSNGLVFSSAYKDDQGVLYFGTTSGLNYINPSSITYNVRAPAVVYTSLSVNHKLITPSDTDQNILTKSISRTDTITLNYNQNIVELSFASLDYNQPDKNRFKYKLSSLHDDWIENGTDNKVMFTNLSPGMHSLSVMGSNNDMKWNESPLPLWIIVRPPFWKTSLAYIIYGFLFILSIYSLLRYQINKETKALNEKIKLDRIRQEEREIIRKNNAADFHDELGNKITKVSLFLSLAERSITENKNPDQWLFKIRKTISELSGGFRDLLWVIDPQKDSLYETAIRLKEFGTDLFENTEVNFTTSEILPIYENIQLDASVKKQVVMMFKEAFNNCLKYAEARNAIFIIGYEEKGLWLKFIDDGQGFELGSKSEGRGLKNMKMRAQKIGAIINIISNIGEGTKIRLSQIPHMGDA